MKLLFVESRIFSGLRADYLSDDQFRALQAYLLENPTAGSVIQGAGGLRKLRWKDTSRGKGARGGLRIIYYWWQAQALIYLLTLYDKGQQDDLNEPEKRAIRRLIEEIKQK